MKTPRQVKFGFYYLPILTLTLLLNIISFTSSANSSALYEKLCEVNSYWQFYPDAAPNQIDVSASDREMIALHLQLVEKELRSRDVQHLPQEQQELRSMLLDKLNNYWKSGAFPINTTHSYRLPIFIDPFDNFCAVGFLIKELGNETLSRMISRNTNFAYLAEMEYPELNNWVASSGFTFEELAWIQPGYGPNTTLLDLNGGTTGTVYTITSDTATSAVYVGGDFTSAGSVAGTNNVAMWNGGQWFPLNNGLVNKVEALRMYNGVLYAGGYDLLPTGNINSVAYWNGTDWISPESVHARVKAMVVYQGELYIGGTSNILNGNTFLAKWNGSTWIQIPITVPGIINSLHVFDGKLIIGGLFTSPDAPLSPNIVSYNGSAISGMSSGVPAEVFSITDFRDTLFAGGEFLGAQGDTFGLAKFTNSLWQQILPFGSFSYLTLDSSSTGRINTLEINDSNTLYLGGDFYFSPMMGNSGKNAAVYHEGSTWSGFNGLAEFNLPVFAIHNADSRSYLGGDFVQSHNGPLAHIGYFFSSYCGSGTIAPNACDSYTSPSGNHIWNSSGTYTDIVTNAFGCDSVITVNLTINTVDASVTDDVTSFTANTDGAQYQWIYCDSVVVAGETGRTFTPVKNGDYAVIVTDNGCNATSACFNFTKVDVQESFASNFKISPNPTDGLIVVDFGSAFKDRIITIRNVHGQVISTSRFTSSENIKLKIEGSAGVYFLEIRSGEGNVGYLKVLKQ